MIWFLRIAFIIILTAMLVVTTWASTHTAIWKIPSEVASHPWFIASLFDAYFGFLTFYIWVAYKESSMRNRAVWLIAILLFGNIAMAIYMLTLLFQLPTSCSIADLLLKKPIRV